MYGARQVLLVIFCLWLQWYNEWECGGRQDCIVMGGMILIERQRADCSDANISMIRLRVASPPHQSECSPISCIRLKGQMSSSLQTISMSTSPGKIEKKRNIDHLTHRKSWACCCRQQGQSWWQRRDCIITTNGGNKRCGALSDMQSLIPTFANILKTSIPSRKKRLQLFLLRLARTVGPLGAHLLKHQREIRCFISIWGI